MPSSRALVGPAALLVAASVLTACGGGGGSSSEGSSEGAGTDEVLIERSRFEPDELTVPAGTEVTWTNLDRATHTVTSAEGSALEFDSGDLALDDEFSQTFDDAGTYDYFCEVHPTMRSTVVVE